jgi:hypothetical protein
VVSQFSVPRLISCDEAGFTGNNLLNPDQPFFAYASHDFPLAEAETLIRQLRADHPVQMPELKASKLLQTTRGRSLISDALSAMRGHYIATLYDKRLSLACKLFEYLYEPVLQANNALFYRHNLHRFVAMFFFMLMRDSSIQVLAQEFEDFMRSLNPLDAPTLFGANPAENPMIGQILRFVRGYNVIIARETRSLGRISNDNWILDLTASAICSHLAAWGQRHSLIEVVCDESKPLKVMDGFFDVMVNRPEVAYVEVFGKRRALTWNMSKPVEFASSKDHAGIQLADLIAGVTASLPGGDEKLADFGAQIEPHLHEDCIFPDFDVLDLEGDEAPVNWLILEELASRADRGDDPLEGMDVFYQLGKASLPDFRQGRFQDASLRRHRR